MSQNTQLRLGQPENNGNRTLYDDGKVCVVGRWLIVDGLRYEIREMRHLRTVAGPRSPLRVNAGIAVGVVLVIIAMTARYLDTRGWIGAGMVLSVPLGFWGFAAANGPRSSELWCEYRGYTVQALWVKGTDHYRYNQICRAITRARENLQ
jgi:uncharacterized protein DUF6232